MKILHAAAPGPPTNLTEMTKDDRSITISWGPPIKAKGILEKYFIFCHNETHTVDADSATKIYVFKIGDLESNTKYNISVWVTEYIFI